MHSFKNQYLLINNKLMKFRSHGFLIHALICALGIFIAFYPTILSGFHRIQTDPGDTVLNNYFLEHSFQLLSNKNYQGELWSPTFFYPYKRVLTFSDNLFGSAPIYWLFRTFLLPNLAFQLWMITVCILSFVSFAMLMQRYRVNHILSALGAFLFAFGMPRISQIGHQQLLPQFFTPLAFLIAWECFKKPTIKRLALFLLLTYLQVLAGVYLGWFFLFSLPIFFSIAYKLDKEANIRLLAYWRSNRAAVTSIFLCWLGIMLLTLLPYIQAKSVLGAPLYSQVDKMLPRISSWFSVPSTSLWSSLLFWASKDLPMAWEHQMFAGFTVVLLTGITIYTLFFRKAILSVERALLIQTCLLVFIILFCLSLRLPFGLTLWKIIYEFVPGASVIRAVTRIWTVAYFYLFIALTLCFDSIINVFFAKKHIRLLVSTIVFFIVFSEQIVFNIPSYEKSYVSKQVNEIRHLIEKNCDMAYVQLDSKQPFYVSQLSAMWAGIEANKPIINGYSGNVPPQYGDNAISMNTIQLINWLNIAGKNISGQLCILSPKLEKNNDTLLSDYIEQTKQKPEYSENFISYKINLPFLQKFGQDLKYFDIPKTAITNSEIKIPVIIKNTSNFIWSNKGIKHTNFSYRWIDFNGKIVNFNGNGKRTGLPYDLSPGDSTALNVVIKTPDIPGKYKLILTMVQENVAWFNDKNPNYPEVFIEIVSQ
ncbi:hypothetical protein B4U84_22050 [Westiellopsis prolifica IICB1]|nr:hypothetical protein B4U84_22050 [Westiellopsis prolifica IICB1]